MADLGYNGAIDIETPNIDRLAAAGTVFTNAYTTTSRSSPARAGLLTGRHPARFGLEEDLALAWLDAEQALPASERTIARHLRQAGYRTGLVGKWHLGAEERRVPLERGFDYFFGFIGRGHDYWHTDANALADEYLIPLVENHRNVRLDGYLTNVLTDKAIEFVNDSGTAPFFLQLAFNAPQRPLDAPRELLAKYAGVQDAPRRSYLAMVDALDNNIGRILDALDAAGILDATLIFLTRDHVAAPPADNGGLRGGGFHEGAIRVPFVASWPSRWPSGSTFQHTASTLDIAATILAAAGATPSASHPALDGVNLDPFLRGERTDAPHEALFWRRSTTGGYAVRRGNMKLVRNRRGDPPALFDLAADPGETVNRLAGDSETANEIAALWNTWNADNTDGNLYTAADTYEANRRQYFEDYEAERLRDAQSQTMRIEAFEESGEAGEATSGIEAGVKPVATTTEPLPPPVNTPNVIIITADDLGYADLGFTGATEISTPGIDRLAREGVVFTNAYTTHTVCSPSRAALITGRHGSRFRLESNLGFEPFDELQGLTTSETTVARHLQTAGYRTGIIGKWHLGGSQPFNPRQRGFGTFFGFLGGGHWYWQTDAGKAGTEHSAPLIDDVTSHHLDGAYLTSAFSDRAVEFVQAARDRPFFLYLPYNAPHGPIEAPASLVAKYDHVANSRRRTYLAMVDAMDTGVGQLLDALEREGLRDNTLIFFLSDHGAPLKQGGDNGVFSGGKSSLSEGGLRVPFVASWPARWPQAATFDPIVSSLDIAATAMAMASASVGGAAPLDGANLDPFVRGERTDVPHDALFWRKSNTGSYAARSGDMKLVKDGGEPRLYNVADDPGETNDLLPGDADIANRLATLWNAWNEHNLDGSISKGMGYYASRRKERLVEIAAETRDGAVGQRFEIEVFEGPAAETTEVEPPNVASTHANGMADNRYPTGPWSESEMRPTANALARDVFPYARPGLDTPGAAGGRLDVVLENRVAATPTSGGLPAAIPDAMLRARIAAALRKPPGAVVGERDLAALRVLNLSGAGIRDLSGLDFAVNLTGLDLSWNPLADLRILQALPSLETLKLDGMAVDPWQLAPMTWLRRLSLRDNGLYDVAALAPLTELVVLDIGNNEVGDLYTLVGLTQLEELRADRNRITDLAALSSLPRLMVLDIGDNEVGDLYPLIGLTQLEELRADGNRITDVAALSSLPRLVVLDVRANPVGGPQ